MGKIPVPSVNTWTTCVHVCNTQPYDIEKPCLLSIWLDVLQQKHTGMRHRSIFNQLRWCTSRGGRQTFSRLTSWLPQKRHSHAVLNPPAPFFTAESTKSRERNLERSENSVGEWQHSAESARKKKKKPKTSDHVWVDYTFATSQGNGVGGGESGGSRVGQEW